jgi:hypothetical protein
MRLDALRHLNRGLNNAFQGALVVPGGLRLLPPLRELVPLPLVGQAAAALECGVLELGK